MKIQTSIQTITGAFIFMAFMVGLNLPLNASLLITPLQVVMENRNRSSEIVLINPSRNTNTYRLEWVQLEQQEGKGGYYEVSPDDVNKKMYLQDFAVYTPRQVTLKPNEKQTVRIGIRRPAELADGEYKSHLKFKILPDLSIRPKVDVKPDPNATKLGASVHASYSIPIIYRAGEYDINVDIKKPTFTTNPSNSRIVVNLPVNRSGIHGAVGQINIYFTPSGGSETLIAQNGNANLFPEITSRTFNIISTVTSLGSGSIRVQYLKAEGKDATKYPVLDEKTFPIN